MTIPFLPSKKYGNRRPHDGEREGRLVYWTLERITAGVRRFRREFGHAPSATEFDLVPYLPSLRHVTMYFRSIRRLRELLGLEEKDFASGAPRAALARELGRRGLDSENAVRDYLERRFGEVCVHVERKVGIGNWHTVRPDFYVFNRTQDFVVDVLNAANAVTLGPHLRLKAKKYRSLHCPVFFVVMNDSLSQEVLNRVLTPRLRVVLGKNVRVLTFTEFTFVTAEYRPYRFDGKLPLMAATKAAHRKYHPRNRRWGLAVTPATSTITTR